MWTPEQTRTLLPLLSPRVPSRDQTTFLCFGKSCQAAIRRREGRNAWRLAPPFCLCSADTASLDSVLFLSRQITAFETGPATGGRRDSANQHETRVPATECRGARRSRAAPASPSAWPFFQMSNRSPGMDKEQRHEYVVGEGVLQSLGGGAAGMTRLCCSLPASSCRVKR